MTLGSNPAGAVRHAVIPSRRGHRSVSTRCNSRIEVVCSWHAAHPQSGSVARRRDLKSSRDRHAEAAPGWHGFTAWRLPPMPSSHASTVHRHLIPVSQGPHVLTTSVGIQVGCAQIAPHPRHLPHSRPFNPPLQVRMRGGVSARRQRSWSESRAVAARVATRSGPLGARHLESRLRCGSGHRSESGQRPLACVVFVRVSGQRQPLSRPVSPGPRSPGRSGGRRPL